MSDQERPDDPSRRRALGRLATGASACVGAALLVPPAALVLTPLFERDAQGERWLVLGPAARFPVGGPPQRVILRGRVQDAWVRDDNALIGSVLVERISDGDFRVFSAVCPHLGCTVRYDGKRGGFRCPCHGASYALDGARHSDEGAPPNPAPRDLDPLTWRLTGADLHVRWARFEAGISDRREVG